MPSYIRHQTSGTVVPVRHPSQSNEGDMRKRRNRCVKKPISGKSVFRGTNRLGQAKKLADLLNEYVLDVFVTVTEKGATA